MKIKQNKEQAENLKQLFENRGHEVVAKRYEDDLLQLDATRTKKTIGWHSYPNGDIAVWVTGFEPDNLSVAKEFFEVFFGMTAPIESPNGFWRLSKKVSKEGD